MQIPTSIESQMFDLAMKMKRAILRWWESLQFASSVTASFFNERPHRCLHYQNDLHVCTFRRKRAYVKRIYMYDTALDNFCIKLGVTNIFRQHNLSTNSHTRRTIVIIILARVHVLQYYYIKIKTNYGRTQHIHVLTNDCSWIISRWMSVRTLLFSNEELHEKNFVIVILTIDCKRE